MMGDTLSRFIQRIRIEKAACELVHNHKKTITEITLENGFSSSSTFAHAFRESFGIRASTWRSGGHRLGRKNGKLNSNTGKDFEIDADGYETAWNAIYGGWLPESGYQPADGPCFEMCLNNPKEHPQHKHIVDICIPVKPLSGGPTACGEVAAG